MSIVVQTQLRGLNIPDHEFRVLNQLADYADEEGGSIFPSVKMVAQNTHKGRRTVQRIIGTLREKGFLVLVREAHQHYAREYRIDLLAIDLFKTEQAARGAMDDTSEPDPGVPPVASGVPLVTSRGATAMAPKPSLQPSKQSSEERDFGPYAEHARIWNEVCKDLPKVLNFSVQRQQKLKLRLATLEGAGVLWGDLCARLAASSFLCGRTEGGYRTSFDWVMEPKNLTKILEGNFDDRPDFGKQKRTGVDTFIASVGRTLDIPGGSNPREDREGTEAGRDSGNATVDGFAGRMPDTG